MNDSISNHVILNSDDVLLDERVPKILGLSDTGSIFLSCDLESFIELHVFLFDFQENIDTFLMFSI